MVIDYVIFIVARLTALLEIGCSLGANYRILRCELSPTKSCSDVISFQFSKLKIRFIRNRGKIMDAKDP